MFSSRKMFIFILPRGCEKLLSTNISLYSIVTLEISCIVSQIKALSEKQYKISPELQWNE